LISYDQPSEFLKKFEERKGYLIMMRKLMGKKSLVVFMVLLLTMAFALPAMAAPAYVDKYNDSGTIEDTFGPFIVDLDWSLRVQVVANANNEMFKCFGKLKGTVIDTSNDDLTYKIMGIKNIMVKSADDGMLKVDLKFHAVAPGPDNNLFGRIEFMVKDGELVKEPVIFWEER
jgi:hypothetical protein